MLRGRRIQWTFVSHNRVSVKPSRDGAASLKEPCEGAHSLSKAASVDPDMAMNTYRKLVLERDLDRTCNRPTVTG